MEAARKTGLLGGCSLRSVRFEPENRRRYNVNDNLGFDEIAAKAGLCVTDFSKFGCTVTKAEKYIEKMFPRIDGDLVFMNFGMYDSDFDWENISASPLEAHGPVTELTAFLESYNRIIDYTLERRRMPVLSTLIPVDAKAHIDHVCSRGNLNRDNVMRWLGIDFSSIENTRRIYSEAVRELAFRREVPLIDIRTAFLEQGRKENLLGPDGFRPNAEGRQVIHDCFAGFMFDYLTF